jgi:hypothetical protein
MKKFILSTLVGLALVSGAFAAGSYVENFDSYTAGGLSYAGGKSTSLGNGAEVYGNNASAYSAVNIYANVSPSWKALRMAQDGTEGANATTATYVVGAVENPSTRANSFTASFDLYLKNQASAPADRFSFNFGNLTGTFPRDGEAGLWSSGQTGSMLSLVWDFYDNTPTPDYVGVQLFKNGTEVSGSRVVNPVPVSFNLFSNFTRINLRYDEEANGGTFTFNTGGTVGSDNLISGGTNLLAINNLGVNFAAGDKFAFSAAVGAASMDMFLDNVSIQSVPEPSAASLLALGIGGLIALRRRK